MFNVFEVKKKVFFILICPHFWIVLVSKFLSLRICWKRRKKQKAIAVEKYFIQLISRLKEVGKEIVSFYVIIVIFVTLMNVYCKTVGINIVVIVYKFIA